MSDNATPSLSKPQSPDSTPEANFEMPFKSCKHTFVVHISASSTKIPQIRPTTSPGLVWSGLVFTFVLNIIDDAAETTNSQVTILGK